MFTPATDYKMANSGKKFLTGSDASDVVYPVKDGSDKKSLGKYCCVPYCTTAFYNKDGTKSGVGLFKFPNDSRKPRRLTLIKRRENVAPDFFQVTTYTKICELHFKAEDIKVHSNSGKKEVKKEEFECWPKSTVNQREEKEPRKPSLCRSRPDARKLDFSNCGEILENYLTGECNESFQPVNTTDLGLALNEEVFVKTCSDCSKLKAEVKELKNENQILKTDNFELKGIINKLKDEEFSFINVQSDPERFKKYTGLSVDQFNILFEYVNPGEKGDNLKYYDAAKRQAGQEVQSNISHNDHSYSQEKNPNQAQNQS